MARYHGTPREQWSIPQTPEDKHHSRAPESLHLHLKHLPIPHLNRKENHRKSRNPDTTSS